MKKITIQLMLLTAVVLIIPTGCKKETPLTNPMQNTAVVSEKGTHTNKFNSDIVIAWMDMQLRVMKTATGIPNVAFVRPYTYSGITLYQSVFPGMPGYKSLVGQLTDMPNMPTIDTSLKYYWPSSANAAMAAILKDMYPTTSVANIASIDSLESAWNTTYSATQKAATITRSVDFGRAVAQAIFDWAQTDGFDHVSDPYTPPTGPGMWVPTPPAYAAASTPYWGNLRVLVAGSGNGAQPPPPTPYSEVPNSAFYNMVKHVYDVSQTLTTDQTNQALYWRDIPGVTAPGHFMNILKQVLEAQNPTLDKAAQAYALTSITVFDAAISCWQTKYNYNLVRPVTYITTVLGHSTWLPLLTTPAHPEYSSAHAVLSSANAVVLTALFGSNYSFTDHTYDYLGYPSRSFNSFLDLAKDAGNSRLYAGIHYQPSINIGMSQGTRVANNILALLNF